MLVNWVTVKVVEMLSHVNIALLGFDEPTCFLGLIHDWQTKPKVISYIHG